MSQSVSMSHPRPATLYRITPAAGCRSGVICSSTLPSAPEVIAGLGLSPADRPARTGSWRWPSSPPFYLTFCRSGAAPWGSSATSFSNTLPGPVRARQHQLVLNLVSRDLPDERSSAEASNRSAWPGRVICILFLVGTLAFIALHAPAVRGSAVQLAMYAPSALCQSRSGAFVPEQLCWTSVSSSSP